MLCITEYDLVFNIGFAHNNLIFIITSDVCCMKPEVLQYVDLHEELGHDKLPRIQ